MSKNEVSNWMNAHPKGINFKCNCGSTVHLDVWVENVLKNDRPLLCMSAECWNCHKVLEQYEDTMLIDMAFCDMIDPRIAKFQQDFNRDIKKPNIIRVVK